LADCQQYGKTRATPIILLFPGLPRKMPAIRQAVILSCWQ
jgi:hypothetical protein